MEKEVLGDATIQITAEKRKRTPIVYIENPGIQVCIQRIHNTGL